MNYLAHLLLANDSPELLVGGLLGDFLRGVDRSQYPEEIQQGIRLHHAIDRFTDDHAFFGRSKNRLQAPYRRYASVLIDIYYDHFLAANWTRYSPLPLEEFVRQTYEGLLAHERTFPARLRRILPYMIAEDWLTSYRSIAGIDRTLQRLSQRVKRQNPLPAAIQPLEENYTGLESDFLAFFPLLMEFAEGQRSTLCAPQHTPTSKECYR